MVNAQKWLDSEYPKDRRNEIIDLDISKGKVKRWDGHERTLKGDLKLAEFINLRSLICSSQELTNLDLSDCENLRELDCHNNELNSLNIGGCSKLEKINCVSNNYLEEIDINNCPKLVETGSGFTRDTENGKLVKGSLITHAKESDTRNILVVGWTGNGKSTLANVISGADIFVEGSGGVGQTTSFKKSDIFQWDGKKYRIIDNIGFGDINALNEADILHRIGQGIYSAKEGINQVFFVFNGRFAQEQVVAFNMFKKFVSDTGITKFTTLVRTNFPDFRDQEECDKDRKNLLNQNEELSEIINSCNGVIHLDNPSIPIIKGEVSEKVRKRKEQEASMYKQDREDSREVVLDHLVKKCLDIYKLKEWDNIYSLVVNHIRKKEEIEKSNNPMKEKRLKEEWNEVTKEIKFRLEFDPLTTKVAIEVGFFSQKIR